mmetsp:Transcript_14043/g.20508  ORF Transcript_14043/g.20508 Transcript_14043/m.20508 type:complete len:636 (-) Transcript_14043:239-2146(-)|eukprot:CAMPEP_0195518912 /NCGR_PEP_ID=MMETSP0794_2-20130614/13919_1 /TAXON_ID=515487 /ORGANISM="Stephanopyxis turris, Strain CCMP 815" /LENGTH=635 /DNA_ID=CAMNT_0040647957 /DNA_START=169 /DNA_END=2076 /DNA_ORIENTATION=-
MSVPQGGVFNFPPSPANLGLDHLYSMYDWLQNDAKFNGDRFSFASFVERYADSCQRNMVFLERHMRDVVIEGYNAVNQPDPRLIAERLREGKAVLFGSRLIREGTTSGNGDHCFGFVPEGDGETVRVLQAWQGKHNLQQSDPIAIDELLLGGGDGGEALFTRALGGDGAAMNRVFGEGSDEWGTMTVTGTSTGTPMGTVSDDAYYASMGRIQEQSKATAYMELKYGVGVGAMIGGVLALVQELCDEDPTKTWVDHIEGVAKGTISGGAGGAAAWGSKRMFEGCAAMGGKSVWRAGAVGAVVGCGISLLYDVTLQQRGKITAIEQRKKMANTLGGGAGGLVGGAGAAVGAVALGCTPVGWAVFLSTFVGGVAVGALGGQAGSALDSALWDASEDQIQHVYQFFGLENSRGQRKQYSYEDFEQAVQTKLDQHSGVKEWIAECYQNSLKLLQALFPKGVALASQYAEDIYKRQGGGSRAVVPHGKAMGYRKLFEMVLEEQVFQNDWKLGYHKYDQLFQPSFGCRISAVEVENHWTDGTGGDCLIEWDGWDSDARVTICSDYARGTSWTVRVFQYPKKRAMAAAAIGVGLVGYGLYKAFFEDNGEDENATEATVNETEFSDEELEPTFFKEIIAEYESS